MFRIVEQTSRVEDGFKTVVVFEVSGCESTNIEAVEGTPDNRTDNVKFAPIPSWSVSR